MKTTPVELDAEGEAMWRALIDDWADGPGHDRFVQRCFATGRLAAAAACYRRHLEVAPADPIARRMQDRVVFLATQALAPSARPAGGRRRSPWLTAIVVAAAALGAALGLLYGAGR
jgi:predicted TPR repeat methyltransferase